MQPVDLTDQDEERRRERLRAWVRDAGGHAVVVRKCGLTPAQASFLSQVINGYRFGERAARGMEQRLGLPQRYLDQAPTQELEVLHSVKVAAKRVPVVGEVKGGMDGYLEELQYPVGHGEGYVEYPATDPAAYALRVRGDSMHPRYRAGEFIVVSPSIESQPGDDVVVSLTDGRKLLKQLNWIRDGEVQLLSINDTFSPLTIQASEVQFMHLVDGRVRRTGFHQA